MGGGEALWSLAKAGSRRERSDSLQGKGCKMYLTADDPDGASACERSSLALLAMVLCVSIIQGETPNPGQLGAFSEMQLLLICLLSNYIFHCTLKIPERHFSGFRENLVGSVVDEDNVFLLLLLQRERKHFPFPTK